MSDELSRQSSRIVELAVAASARSRAGTGLGGVQGPGVAAALGEGLLEQGEQGARKNSMANGSGCGDSPAIDATSRFWPKSGELRWYLPLSRDRSALSATLSGEYSASPAALDAAWHSGGFVSVSLSNPGVSVSGG